MARAQEPIRIGFSMALAGGLAGTGKPALMVMEIWRDHVNAQGKLLGRPVAQAAGLEIVYDETYPPKTADFTPIVRTIQAIEPDVVYGLRKAAAFA